MKKRTCYFYSIFLGSMVLAYFFSCSVRKSEPITGQTVDTTIKKVAQGEQLFMTYCYKCHPGGAAGLGPALFYKPGFAKKFQVRHGLGAMPSFKAGEISKEKLDAIVLYLKKKQEL